ncbi:hypothetical protein F511_27824 [Dorcoceras hygrometricum]|uniref:Uncharacterized protein n=1 Tax=Dorcoceras hygrometricum TaxID=472368 RepID=A0A2Z7BZ24_9LAMI|nr:hypothetical protein F511_27824 [Dorcoceras hygrometricum]
MRPRDQRLLFPFVLPAPDTTGGAPPTGPPPGPAGPNLTSPGPNHGRTREHDSHKVDARRYAETHNARCFHSSQWFGRCFSILDHSQATLGPP